MRAGLWLERLPSGINPTRGLRGFKSSLSAAIFKLIILMSFFVSIDHFWGGILAGPYFKLICLWQIQKTSLYSWHAERVRFVPFGGWGYAGAVFDDY